MKDWYHTHTAALIEHNILKAYRYLVRNYEIGSKLYFFGVGYNHFIYMIYEYITISNL